MRQIILIELGMGVDLQGQDSTKAALRAVRDAIGRNYLPSLRDLLAERRGRMVVLVRLGVPDQAPLPDIEQVRASLPHGEVTVEVQEGGLLVPDGRGEGNVLCIVNAAVEVAIES
jgi:uncharacterized protein (TIGR02058 family)